MQKGLSGCTVVYNWTTVPETWIYTTGSRLAFVDLERLFHVEFWYHSTYSLWAPKKKPCQQPLSVTHMVQWAVSVGEVKSFQAVGLTQEVVEMLKVKNSTKLALYPRWSFSGCVKYFLCYMVKGKILSSPQMCLNLDLSCYSLAGHDCMLKLFVIR